MFDMLYGIRLWRSHKLQGILLILGFAVFASLINIVLLLAPSLFSDIPPWVKAEENFITIGLKGHDGKMQATTSQNLQRLTETGGIAELGYIGARPSSFRINDNQFHGQIVMFSDELPSMLNLTPLSQDIQNFHQEAYVSRRFLERNLLSQTVKGQTLILDPYDTPLKVAGFLPESLNKIGIWQPDILISARHLSNLIPLTIGEGNPPEQFLSIIRKQLTEQMPVWYGIAQLLPGHHISDIKWSTTAELDGGQVRLFSGVENLKPYFFSGIEFMPEARLELRKRWWFIFGLAMAFGLVNSINLLTLSFNRLLQRSQEMSVRIALGARPTNLLRQLIIEYCPLMFFSLLLGVGGSLFFVSALLENYLVLEQPRIIMICLALAVTSLTLVLIIILCSCIPLLHLVRNGHFIRDSGGKGGPWQQRLGQLNMVVQISLAGLSISIAVALLFQQWQSFASLPLAENTREWVIKHKDSSSKSAMNIQHWEMELKSLQIPVTMSASRFVHPHTLTTVARLDTPDNSVSRSINVLPISSNYFSVLDVSLLGGGAISEHGVVINVSALKALGFRNPKDIIGQTIFLEEPGVLGFESEETIRINGVVPDLPHFGILNTSVPMIYGDLERAGMPRELAIYTSTNATKSFEQWLEGKLQQEGSSWYFTPSEKLIKLLKEENKSFQQIVKLALVLSCLICVLSATSLYYQFSSHLQLQQRRYGIQLAVGAQAYHIILSVWRVLTLLLLISVVPVVLSLVFLHPWFLKELQTPLLHFNVLFVTFIFVLCLCFSSSIAPCYKLTRLTIAKLLRNQD
jgi:ABC-type antimicrobial peptide transport system permease subunit